MLVNVVDGLRSGAQNQDAAGWLDLAHYWLEELVDLLEILWTLDARGVENEGSVLVLTGGRGDIVVAG